MENGAAVDPVSAIANAVGDLFKGATAIITNSQIKKINYQEWLRETFPEYRDMFKSADRKTDNTKLYVVLIMSAIFIILILAVILKATKSKK